MSLPFSAEVRKFDHWTKCRGNEGGESEREGGRAEKKVNEERCEGDEVAIRGLAE